MDPEAREDLRMLYNVSVADIALFKNRQVSITNYTVAIYAALAAIDYQFLRDDPLWQDGLLALLALVVLLFSILTIRELDQSIRARKSRLANIRPSLSGEFRKAWHVGKPKDSFRYYVYAINLLGFIVVILLICSGSTMHAGECAPQP